MSYITTTGYGSWYNVQGHESTIASSIAEACGDYANDYDLEAVEDDYRAAIQAALPDTVTLTGDEFIGPYYDKDKDFDGYPEDPEGSLDLTAIIESVDLIAIVEKHELIDAEEVAARLEYKGASAAATARKTLSRWGVKAAEYRPHPESGRPQARYRAREFEAAVTSRPGQGARTDKA